MSQAVPCCLASPSSNGWLGGIFWKPCQAYGQRGHMRELSLFVDSFSFLFSLQSEFTDCLLVEQIICSDPLHFVSSPTSLDHYSIGSLDHYSIGSLDHWIIGLLDYWIIGSLDHWIIGLLDHWIIIPLDYWIIGLLDHWTIGLLDYWITGSLETALH